MSTTDAALAMSTTDAALAMSSADAALATSTTDAALAMSTTYALHLDPPRDARRRALARTSLVRHPGLAEIASVVEADDGLVVTWVAPAVARPFADSITGRTAESVIRAFASVAAGLAQLHDADCVHGAVGIERVWVRPDGSGVLAPGIAAGAPADDVHALVEVMREVLPSHSVGADLAHLLVIGGDPDPDARPSMARVAAVLDLARRRLAPPSSPPAPRRAGTCPEPGVWGDAAATPSASIPLPPPPPSVKASRARHAAPAGRLHRRPSWRAIAALAGVAVASVLVIGATRGPEAPLVCPAAATPQTPPAVSPDRWSDHSS